MNQWFFFIIYILLISMKLDKGRGEGGNNVDEKNPLCEHIHKMTIICRVFLWTLPLVVVGGIHCFKFSSDSSDHKKNHQKTCSTKKPFFTKKNSQFFFCCKKTKKNLIVMNLKNSNVDETQKVKWWWNSKSQIVMKLKNLNLDETQKLKLC